MISKAYPKKVDGLSVAMTAASADPNITIYDYQMRIESVMSKSGLFLLLLAVFNYFFSFAYKRAYDAYMNSSAAICPVPGASILASYSIFLVMGVGTLALGLVIVAFLHKLYILLYTLYCPLDALRKEQKRGTLPTDFSQYLNEFDYAIDRKTGSYITTD